MTAQVPQAPVRPYGIGIPPKMTEEAIFPPQTSDPVLIGEAKLPDPFSVIDPKFAGNRLAFTLLAKSMNENAP